MVDIMDINKPLNITIGTVMKNLDILKFVIKHLKNKTCVIVQLKNYFIY